MTAVALVGSVTVLGAVVSTSVAPNPDPIPTPTILPASVALPEGSPAPAESAGAPFNKPTESPAAPEPQPQSDCDPNYSGCVPVASDVDCAEGKGNGPAYIRGPVRVIGTDIYGLDRDGDGVGCE